MKLLARAMVAALLAAPAIAQTLDYPQWRGVTRDGSASGFVVPKTWPERLTRKWRIEVGEGYATPIGIGSTVFAFTRQSDHEVLRALDASNGRERWRTGYSAPYTPSKPSAMHGAGPKATPLWHRRRIFTVGISGIVSAFDAATGKLLWQSTAPAESPLYSAASSPLGYEGLVITHPGNYDPLTAFDAETGHVRWKAGGKGFFASPILIDLEGVPQIVTVLPDSVVGVSPLDGVMLWSYPWNGGGGSVTPATYKGMILVTGLNAGTMAIRPRRENGTWVVDRVWHSDDVYAYTATPVVSNGALFGLSHKNKGQLFALDAMTGRTLWLGEPRAATNSAIVKAGNVLFFLNDDAQLTVATNSRVRFEVVRRYPVAESATWAQPLITGRRVFVKDASTLTLWTVD
jgi:outer membrane protein assembly factor BamB